MSYPEPGDRVVHLDNLPHQYETIVKVTWVALIQDHWVETNEGTEDLFTRFKYYGGWDDE